MATRRYIYVIVNPKTNKLLLEYAFEQQSDAVEWRRSCHPKGLVKELEVLP